MKKFRLIATAMAAVMCISAVPVSAVQHGWESGEGTGRYILHDGAAATGVMNIDGVVYRFDSYGSCLGRYTGIGRKNGAIRYYRDGIMFTGGWLKLSGGTYYFDQNGVGAVGIVTIDGKQYNFGSDGRLTDSVNPFSVTADKQLIVMGNRDKIKFTFTAENISGTAYMGEITELQRYSDGKWYKVKPSDSYVVNDVAYELGNVGDPYYYNGSADVYFTPEAYSNNITAGKYRIAQTIYTDNGQKRLFCEFSIADRAAVSTSQPSYDIMSTERIDISGYAVNAGEYYAEAQGLYVYNDDTDEWDRVEPKETDRPFVSNVLLSSGDSINCFLDLTRYSRTRLKSGKYRALIADNISCEFEMTNPYDVYAEQFEPEKRGKKQIVITFVNTTDSDITVKGYGKLMRQVRGKWITVTAGKALDTEVTVPAMHKWEKTMVLNKYYSASDLKSGSYCMKFPTASGGYVYAYFELK